MAENGYSAARPRAEVDRRAGALAQLEVARHEVGVEVRQEHVPDPAAEPVRVLEVLLDVALGVDHGRDAGGFVGDQVRGVREAAEVVLLEDHGAFGLRISWPSLTRARTEVGCGQQLFGPRRQQVTSAAVR